MQNKYVKETINEIKEEESGKGTNPKKKKQVLISRVLKDGTIIETVFDSENEKTSFAVFQNGVVEYKESIEINGEILFQSTLRKIFCATASFFFPVRRKNTGRFQTYWGEYRYSSTSI